MTDTCNNNYRLSLLKPPKPNIPHLFIGLRTEESEKSFELGSGS